MWWSPEWCQRESLLFDLIFDPCLTAYQHGQLDFKWVLYLFQTWHRTYEVQVNISAEKSFHSSWNQLEKWGQVFPDTLRMRLMCWENVQVCLLQLGVQWALQVFMVLSMGQSHQLHCNGLHFIVDNGNLWPRRGQTPLADHKDLQKSV